MTLTNVQITGFGPSNGPFTVSPGGSSPALSQGDPEGTTTVTITGLANGIAFYDVGSVWGGLDPTTLAGAPVINAFPPSSTISVYDFDQALPGGVLVGVLASPVPAPEEDLGIAAVVMVAGAAFLARRRRG